MKAIIFDLDGVIVFTDKYHYIAWKKLADKLGIYFDEKINDRLRGVSRMDSLEIILERHEGAAFTEGQKKALAEEKKVDLPLERARKLFAEWHTTKELSDDELDNVAGGCGDPITCPSCGSTNVGAGSLRHGKVKCYNCGRDFKL